MSVQALANQPSSLQIAQRLAREFAQTAAERDAEALLQRAFQKLFDEQAGELHVKVENALLRAAYRFCHCNQVHTANLLGLSRNITRTRLIKIGELEVNRRRSENGARAERIVQLSI